MIKVAIIGLGAIGQRLIKQFTENEDIEITAVCDPLKERLKATVEELSLSNGYSNHIAMLEEASFDLAYVAVPPKYHYQIVSDVVAKNKHVLCEKPLANSIQEAESLYTQASEKGIIHAMNFPLNYSADSNTFAALLKQGYVGDLRRIELKMHFPNWPRLWQQNDWVASKEQGGFVLEVGVHYIQQIQRIFGPMKVVQKKTSFPVNPKASENAIIAWLELEDGTPILVDGMSQIAGKEEIKFTAYGTEGTLSLHNWTEIYGAKTGEEMKKIDEDSTLSFSLIDELVKKIQGEDGIVIDFSEGYQAQIVLENLRS